MSLSNTEIMTMCTKLSYKFNRATLREDLLQEGLLVCYSLLEVEPEAHPAKLYRAAKTRMHSYVNIDILPVSVPASRDVQEALKGNDNYSRGNGTIENREWITKVLRASSTEYDDTKMCSDADQAQEFEDKEYAQFLYETALHTLNKFEWHVISLKYYDNLSQLEIADGLGVSQQRVSLVELMALTKLKSILDENPKKTT